MRTSARFAFLLLGLSTAAVVAQQVDQNLIAGLSPQEALARGERMYRRGLLPSGEPMRAVVQGDIEVDGTMFSCASCHLRSGRGSTEGTVITLPVNGAYLAKPLVGLEMSSQSRERLPEWFTRGQARPAYTDEALADAIILGRDPTGRQLNPVMPRYELDEADVKVLTYYLRNLSAQWSPGVTDTTLRFATIVTEGVRPSDRDAMLAVLDAHVRDHNSQVRHEEERKSRGPYYKEEKWNPYRRWSLARWELKGPPDTWRAQLEAYEAGEPVFALLGGLAVGDWAPIHRFAEDHGIPCLFPVTDYPVVSDRDWYTLYFSKGLYQEGETAARFLRRSDSVDTSLPAVQIFRDNPQGRALARGFRETCSALGLPVPEDHALASDAEVTRKNLPSVVTDRPGSAVVVWLGEGDLGTLAALEGSASRPLLLASASLLGDPLHGVPESLRGRLYLTYPSSLPEDQQRTRVAIERWLQVRSIPLANYGLQARMYFVGWMLSGIVKMMRDDFYRDYLLDLTDMMRDQDYAIGVYPRLSFGPGQRYASKGCYVVQVTAGPEPKLVRRSEWVIQ